MKTISINIVVPRSFVVVFAIAAAVYGMRPAAPNLDAALTAPAAADEPVEAPEQAVPPLTLDFPAGDIAVTGRALDLAIDGRGFFVGCDLDTGELCYIRRGRLALNENMQVVVGSPESRIAISPPIPVPMDAIGIRIEIDGAVRVQQRGSAQLNSIGQLQLADFTHPLLLRSEGGVLFRETDKSGPPILSCPGQSAAGLIRQCSLEIPGNDAVEALVGRWFRLKSLFSNFAP